MPRKRLARLVFLTIVLAALAITCSDDEPTTAPEEEAGTLIGPEGGRADSQDGGASLFVSSGALSEETPVTVRPIPASDLPPSADLIPGTAYDFGPDGMEFASGVIVAIAYDPADLPEGIGPNELQLHRLENGNWVPIPGSQVRGRVAFAVVTHFTGYGVGASEDLCAEIECTGGQVCYGGSCWDACDSETAEGKSVCFVDEDPCADIQCPEGQACYEGGCYDTCDPDSADDLCYDQDPCEGIVCPSGQVCYWGSCWDTCTEDSGANSVQCWTPEDACVDVECAQGQICYGGSCWDACDPDSPDCFAGCTSDDQCGTGFFCDVDRGVCVEDPCEGVVCPAGLVCYGGSCWDSGKDCSSGAEACADDEICVSGTCIDDPCAGVTCVEGQVCYYGSCYDPCFGDSCIDPGDGQSREIAFASDRSGTRGIFLKNLETGAVTTIQDGAVTEQDPVWSPDGTRIAFTRNGVIWIYCVEPPGSCLEQLSSTPGDKFGLAWSPDGTELAYVDASDGDWEIYVMSVADPSQVRKLTDNTSQDRYPTWSPDGTRIAFTRDHEMLLTMSPVDGSDEQLLLAATLRYPDWSPDGSRIVFSRALGGTWQLLVLTLADGAIEQITDDGAFNLHPDWSPEGDRIAYARNDQDPNLIDDVFDLWVVNADGSDPHPVEVSPADDFTPDWRPVGGG